MKDLNINNINSSYEELVNSFNSNDTEYKKSIIKSEFCPVSVFKYILDSFNSSDKNIEQIRLLIACVSNPKFPKDSLFESIHLFSTHEYATALEIEFIYALLDRTDLDEVTFKELIKLTKSCSFSLNNFYISICFLERIIKDPRTTLKCINILLKSSNKIRILVFRNTSHISILYKFSNIGKETIKAITENLNCPEDIIQQNIDLINLNFIVKNRKFSLDFIKTNINRIEFNTLKNTREHTKYSNEEFNSIEEIYKQYKDLL